MHTPHTRHVRIPEYPLVVKGVFPVFSSFLPKIFGDFRGNFTVFFGHILPCSAAAGEDGEVHIVLAAAGPAAAPAPAVVGKGADHAAARRDGIGAGLGEGAGIIRPLGAHGPLTGSLRGYTMLGTASSAVYPKWGIGAEIGASGSLESSQYMSPMGYFYLYGYVPGILAEQGLKLTAMTQQKLRSDSVFGQPIVSVLPRGLSSNASLASWISIRNSNITKITADYAVPIYIGDVSLGGTLFSIKRLVVSPHFDYTFFGKEGLFSVGGSIGLDMHSILTLCWPCSFGVTMSYNGGSAWNSIDSSITLDRFHIGPTFNVSF